MSLKDSNLIMIPDLDLPPTGEYPYLVNFDEPPYTERVKAITTLDGDISEGIYQFSTNPWLPIYEYVNEYDKFPMALKRVIEDKPHLPIWFMTKTYRNSTEVSIAYNSMDYGELLVDDLIDIYREGQQDEVKEAQKKFEPSICYMCAQSFTGWNEQDDIFNMWDPSCTLCILGDQLWRTRKMSKLSDNPKERVELTVQLPVVRHRMEYLIKKHYPILEESISRFIQESDTATDFFAAADSDNDEALLDMFG
jgi:hypothetical protein